jgi:bifunctional enzyme CysN/CysC
MAHQSNLIAENIHAYLKAQEEKSMLRFITCGSVDDGKSTLIGRLLWDSKMVFEDQLASLEADSKRVGTQGEAIDYALLLDGLQAEREQGITIDVAYRYFSTDKRKFIVADTPGHEQYTRNMVTGASTAQVAVILIDARKGILTQTRRHSYLVSLVGIKNIVLAINKMDLVDYSQARFESIRKEYELFAGQLGFKNIQAIPISALEGDNAIHPSPKTAWYDGPALMEHLETVDITNTANDRPFRMRVQWVNRPNLDFRGFCGTIASGSIRQGDEIVVTSSGQTSAVERIVTMNGDLPEAIAGQAVTLTLKDEIDISRGDLLADPQARPDHSGRFTARLVWMHEDMLVPGRNYLIKAGSTVAPARITSIDHKVNVNSLQQENGSRLELNEIGACTLEIDRPISFDSYCDNRSTGSFIVIDRMTNATVGAGMIDSPLADKSEHHNEQEKIDRQVRARQKGQNARIFWFFGTDAFDTGDFTTVLEKKLNAIDLHTHNLDYRDLRNGLNKDIANKSLQRSEETRRLAELAKVCADAGLVVLVNAPNSFPRANTGEVPVDAINIDEYFDTANKSTWGGLEEHAEQLMRSYFR